MFLIFQVLSDPQKKTTYDQYGEEGLKDMPPPSSGGFSSGNGSAETGFNPRNAEDIFAEFFGSSPFGFGSSGPGRSMRFQSDGSGNFGGFGGSENIFRTYSESNMPKKPPPVESKLPCSLQELYSGSTRKMKISRTVVDAKGYAAFLKMLCPLFFFCLINCCFELDLAMNTICTMVHYK
jgi:DnaJ family protein B protein 4